MSVYDRVIKKYAPSVAKQFYQKWGGKVSDLTKN